MGQVYQENIWTDKARFVSFRKVAHDLGLLEDPASGLQLISFHSVSKVQSLSLSLYCDREGLTDCWCWCCVRGFWASAACAAATSSC